MQAGVKPVVHLIADAGFDNYQTTINISRKMVDEKKDVVQRFVNASLEGWAEYMKGGPAIEAANALIKKDNPDMTDDKIAYALKVMNERGIVKSGDALKLGIGAMTDERWKRFYETMTAAGAFPPGIDYKKAYSLEFVNKGVGGVTHGWLRRAPNRHARPLVSIRNVSKQFANGTLADPRRRSRSARRRIRQPARAVGLRQVDAAAHHRRAWRAQRRHDRLADRAA